MVRRGFAVAVLAVMLGAAGKATAEPAARPIPPIVFGYLVAAEAYWGKPPPCPINVRWATEADPSHAARATIDGCAMSLTIGSPLWRDPLLAETACIAVLHEYGHMLGYLHNPDPTSVMHETDGWITPPADCEHATRRIYRLDSRIAATRFLARDLLHRRQALLQRRRCGRECRARIANLSIRRHKLLREHRSARRDLSVLLGS